MKLMTLTLSAAMAAGIVLAQDGPMRDRERRNRTPDEAISALNLTPEQVTALQENQRALRQATRVIQQEITGLNQQLRTEMSQDNPNASAAGQFLVDMKSKREEIKTTAGQFQAQALEILDDNQKAALAALEQTRQAQPALRQAGSLGLTSPGPGKRGFGGRGPRGKFGAAAIGGFRGGGRRGFFRDHRGPRPATDDAPTQ